MGREGVTLTHWRKNAEEMVPGVLGKKFRGRPGESGGLNGSGESWSCGRRLEGEARVGGERAALFEPFSPDPGFIWTATARPDYPAIT